MNPIAQDLEYHNFVDKRGLWFIPNFGDTLSNIPYLIVGILGVIAIYNRRNDQNCFQSNFEIYMVLTAFIGIAIVCFGSGYYHWNPSNESLVWDRLPMTIGFMALFSMIISERIDLRVAKILFPIFLFLGVFSVFYWSMTERAGVGDLRLYVLVQFFPLLVSPLILLNFKAKYTETKYLWLLMAWYGIAKLFEHFDSGIFALLDNVISGHTIKHLASAIGTYYLVLYIKKRQLVFS